MALQDQWRYCGKCHAMFYDGYPDKGRCAAGGGHAAIGYEFILPFAVSATANAQTDWRFCGKCHGLFYDGYPNKGRCPAGGGHAAIGYNFVIPHDIGGTARRQINWRFCVKCHAMFYDGYPDKGRCPAGGGHLAMGYNFAIQHFPVAAPPPPPPTTPPPPARPTISVSQPPGSVILVSGSGFSPNAQVRIRFVVGAPGNEGSSYVGTDGTGRFVHREPGSGIPPGITIWVSATDGRPDRSDLTGFLWSNTVPITFSPT